MKTIDDNDKLYFPHPDEEKRPVMAVIGLVLGILGWIGIFAFPTANGMAALHMQAYIIAAVAAIALVLSFAGRKRAPGMAFIGIVVSAALMLFMIIPLFVMKVSA